MDKFDRNYSLAVGTDDGGTLTIALPFTIEFDITKNILTSANVCQIRIYNLSETNRNKIRFNFYNSGEFRPILLNAGYGEKNLPTIFNGNITQAWSVREGNNFVTTIECFDGGAAFANATTSLVVPSGTPQSTVIANVVKDLAPFNVTPGHLGSYPGSIARANSYSGSTTDILRELTGGGFFIDNQKANCLGNAECVPGGIPVINAQSGLLGTPVLEQTILNFDMIFEPGVIMAQQILLQTNEIIQNFNGLYKVISIKHRGMISRAVCGEAVTSLGMFYGPSELSIAGSFS